MFFHKTIATFFGIGYIGKGAGTAAAFVVGCLLYLSARSGIFSNNLLLLLCAIILAAGIYTAGKVEKSWGKDSRYVVIDEVFGMAISMLFLPINLLTLLIGFVLFRFFDILKPLFIRRLEVLPGGWGVMLDDLLAGIYANVILQLIIFFTGTHYEDIF